jgi:threonine dehydratase
MSAAAATVGPADVVEARRRIRDTIRATPARRAESLARALDRPLYIKPEHLQRTGSFKIRGALNLLAQLPAGQAVVAGSAGNHAQGVALAARLTGRRATIFMPHSASLPKVAATRDYGAEVRLEGETVDDAIAAARAHAQATGARFVPPFDDPAVVAGQGTIGLELAEEVTEATTVLVPVGGGGLLAGIASALAGGPHRVVGVAAEGADSMARSLAAGRLVTLERTDTIADGIALKAPSPLTFEVARRHVADVVVVSDEAIARAVLLLLERAKAVVEPAGAAGLAALLDRSLVPGTGPVTVVLSGGNVDSLLLGHLIERGLTATGRYLRMRVVVPDRPGGLARVAAAVAEVGLNVLEVVHQRRGISLDVDEVAVDLTVETRGREHRDAALATLAAQGWDVQAL